MRLLAVCASFSFVPTAAGWVVPSRHYQEFIPPACYEQSGGHDAERVPWQKP
jgi:hypothetical protein